MDKQTQDNLLKLVHDNYALIAEKYNETRKKPLLPRWQKLVDFTEKVKEASRVLDAGCGNGRLLEAFEGKKIEYLGFDTNGKLVNYARNQHPGFDFYVADIMDPKDVEDNYYDHIFSIAVINHIPGYALRVKVIRQLAGKLKNGGTIFLSAWNLWSSKKHKKILLANTVKKTLGINKMEIGDAVFDWKDDKGNIVSQRYYHAFTLSEFKKLGQACGLQAIEISQDEFNIFAVYQK